MQLKQFLEEQLEWCKQQDLILEKIEEKLFEMKCIAEYVSEHVLSSSEMSRLNRQLQELKCKADALEKLLRTEFH